MLGLSTLLGVGWANLGFLGSFRKTERACYIWMYGPGIAADSAATCACQVFMFVDIECQCVRCQEQLVITCSSPVVCARTRMQWNITVLLCMYT